MGILSAMFAGMVLCIFTAADAAEINGSTVIGRCHGDAKNTARSSDKSVTRGALFHSAPTRYLYPRRFRGKV